ncbi:TIGR02099 family protein [Pandoraea terrae]|uniref:TIGR02099 family protein n=1 Tax=Pandoraea terrae TaxID=1537710 RepID=A0A5E4Z7X9_9BURK|nr:YhdP family protein [Pandoraea terrae]VVE57246.1 TIGR02099 family protein [Pandoraea terrae]
MLRAARIGLEWAIGLVIGAYFLLGAAVLVTRYVVLPRVADYRPQIEAAATRAIGLPVTIGRIEAAWQGWHPYLTLEDVRLTQAGSTLPGLSLHRVDAILSWSSLTHLDFRLSSLTLVQPDLQVERLADGSLLVAGIPAKGPGNRDSAQAADWVMRQARVTVRDGVVRWRDATRNVPEITLTGVNATLRNRGLDHRFGMQATPSAGMVAPLDVRARFTHPLFASPGDVKRWHGQAYAEVGTLDLAALAKYVTLPDAQTRGKSAARVWIDFDQNVLTAVTARVAATGVWAQLAAGLPPLSFDSGEARIDVQRVDDGFSANIRDLTLRVASRAPLEIPALQGTYAPENAQHGLRVALTGKQLDLGALLAIAPALPLPKTAHELLASYHPRGTLRDFDFSLQQPRPIGSGTNWRDLPGLKRLPPERSRYRFVADFDNAGVDSLPNPNPPSHPGGPHAGRPGFDHLSGRIDADQGRGTVTLDSRGALLDFPGRFDNPRIALDTMAGRATWRVTHSLTNPDEPAKIDVRVDSLRLSNAEVTGAVAGTWASGGKGNGLVDLHGTIARANANAVPRYLPTDIGASVREYLSNALLGGTVQNAPFVVQGDLEDFPYGHGGGKFKVDIPLLDARFDPAPQRPGHRQSWPPFEAIHGTLHFDADKLRIGIDSASAFGVTLSQVQGEIAGIGREDAELTIRGDTRGPMQDFLRYVNTSPVGGWIGDFTTDTRASGQAQLALQLVLPLEHSDRAKVNGHLRFLRNDVMLLTGLPVFGGVDGELAFTERGVQLENLRGRFLGSDIRAAGGSREDGSVAITVNGMASAEGLRNNGENASLAQIAKRMSGAAAYTATVNVQRGLTEIGVQSNLAGLAVNLPAPLGKPAETTMPARFTLRPQASAGGRRVDVLDMTIGPLQANFVQQHAGNRVEVLRGGIGVNQPAPTPREGVQAAAQFDTLDIDAWRAVLAEIEGVPAAALAPVPLPSPASSATAALPARSSQAAAARDELGALGAYVPTRVALHARQIRLMSRSWPELVIGAQRVDNEWQANLASQLVSGFVQWKSPNPRNPSGLLTARLAKLVIPREEHGDVLTQVLEAPSDEFPAIDLVVGDFVLHDKSLGKLELDASNGTEDGVPVWQLTKLDLTNSAAVLAITGNWRTSRRRAAIAGDGEIPRRTVLDFKLDVKDAGALLNRLGLPKTVRNGEGTIAGRFGWRGGPDAIDYPTLGGRMTVDLKRGQILKADPGLAKLLGILSLQSLAKILTFDFNGLVGEGLPFDEISGHATMQSGVATTDDLTIYAGAATIKVDGRTDLAKETQDLKVLVLPKINAGSASIAYAFINPVLGIGSFFAQLALGEQLSKTLSSEYTVTGSWDNPLVRQSGTNRGKMDASPIQSPGS